MLHVFLFKNTVMLQSKRRCHVGAVCGTVLQVVSLTESAERTERADNSSNILTEDLHHFADHI